MNTEFAQLKMEDLRKELPEMVRSLEAYRQGSNNTLPIEVTLEELVQGKYGVSQDAFFEKLGINPKIDTMQNIFTMPQQNIRCTGNHPCCYYNWYAPGTFLPEHHCFRPIH